MKRSAAPICWTRPATVLAARSSGAIPPSRTNASLSATTRRSSAHRWPSGRRAGPPGRLGCVREIRQAEPALLGYCRAQLDVVSVRVDEINLKGSIRPAAAGEIGDLLFTEGT